MTLAPDADILVAGGGIGGLAAALCAVRHGLKPLVLERSADLAETGAGLQISPNGMKVLTAVGAGPAVEAVAFEPDSLDLRLGRSGRRIFSIPMGARARSAYGAPYLHLHRADLRDALAATLEQRAPGALVRGVEVEGFEEQGDGVLVRATDGRTWRGGVLVGADGIHSVVRSRLWGAAGARFTGNVAWRAVVPSDQLPAGLIPTRATVWAGPGRHAVTYYLRRGALVNLVAVVEQADWKHESWTEPGDPATLVQAFQGFAEPVRMLADRVQACHRWALHDRDPATRWGRGRVTLLGDAAHPMLPFLAQGAVMAIEDGWVLAARVAAQGGAGALRAYEAARQPRTARVQLGARANMGVFHKASGPTQFMTYAPMMLADRLLPGFVHSRQDWLYAHDVTAPT